MAVVLVGEGDPDIRYALWRVLSRAGHDVVAVADGPSVLAAASSCRAVVVIIDCVLPKAGGFEVCQALGEDPRTAGSAVVMVSARALPGEVSAALRAGVSEVLLKPFLNEQLLSRVNALAHPAPAH